MKFLRKTSYSYSFEETFKIYVGSTLLFTSSTCPNNDICTTEQCVTSSTNNQYTLKLIDSYGDSWQSGSYLTIYGKYVSYYLWKVW